MAAARIEGERYSSGAIVFHWLIALLVVTNLALALLYESLLDGVKWVMPAHMAIGITVLVLTLVRIAWRLGHRPPPLPLTGWQRGAVKAVHVAFYVLLLAVPLAGWAFVSGAAKRFPITWFGLFDIPFLPVSRAAGGIAKEAHEIMAFLVLGLIVLHVAAALRHHYLLRDDGLTRMLLARVPRR